MKRSFNYTGRVNIDNNKIMFLYNPNAEYEITLDKIDLSEYPLIDDSEVYAEIFYRNEYKRQKIGTVNNIALPAFISLKDLSYKENLSFRIIVVNPTEQKIIGATSIIKLATFKINEDALLPLKYDDLGKVVWKIDYEHENVDKPVLLINKNIPGIEKIAVSDPAFIMTVYPAVLREILLRIIFIEKVNPKDASSNDWRGQWHKYAIKLNKRENLPEVFIDDENYGDDIKEEWYEWIECVVKKFCEMRNEWESYIKSTDS